MTFRPYPNRDRALRQLARGRRPVPPTEFQARLAAQAQAAMECADRLVGPVVRDFREGLARWADAQPSGSDLGASLAQAFIPGPAPMSCRLVAPALSVARRRLVVSITATKCGFAVAEAPLSVEPQRGRNQGET